jgi:hypothetical protein
MSSRRTFLIAATIGTLGLVGGAAFAEGDGGFVSINSRPPALVSITNEKGAELKLGNTPVAKHALPAGSYKVTFVSHDGKHRRTLGFTVRSGQHTKLQVSLAD